ncbi:MAG: sigma-70 family RNA polymerase sigma factor [Lacipirellulaceae bacterium]
MADSQHSQQDQFAQQLIANQGRLYAYIATLLPNRTDAEDVLQRTSLILCQKWEHYDTGRAFLPWARGIALNEIRNFLRRSERKNIHLSEPMISILAEEIEDEQPQDRIDALVACLEGLEPKQRHLLEQCYLGTNGVKAVAASMNSSADAIYMRLHRIRKFLVACINKRLALDNA